MSALAITLLCENEASAMPWKAERGFSAWIEYRGIRVLFDTGFSDVWRFNADDAGLDLETADWIALSHIHRDHTRGLLHHGFAGRKRIVLHPRILKPAPEIPEDPNAAGDYREIQRILRTDLDVIETRAPFEFAPGAWFLGEIPRVTPFERGAYVDDPVPDDKALASAGDERGVAY